MWSRPRLGVVAAVTAAALVTVPAVAYAGADRGTSGKGHSGDRHSSEKGRSVALSANGLKVIGFDLRKPSHARDVDRVRGLEGDDRLVGIDFRVQDRKLYGVGDEGGVYTVDTRSGKADKVSQLSVQLDGDHFGVDFNPAANRLRIISDTGQNLRHNIDDGPTADTTIVDGALTYPPATAVATGVTAAAYTNNDLDADTATTLFVIDTALDQIAVQSPANAGTLAATAKLGKDAGPRAGFDLYSELDRSGATTSVTGYAVLNGFGPSTLYKVDVLTGDTDRVGGFRWNVSDIAVALDR